ncbi:MAG: hypothetical protein HYV27_17795 [Candidatus Hydrogenedentes bacterium]|nr:hypothetical protein [Candidatus Hydrogenedentota bacterium]
MKGGGRAGRDDGARAGSSRDLDIGGRIESKAESLGLTATDYGYVYDEVGQLEQVVDHLDSNAVVESYGYDANGNRTSSTVDYGAAVTRTYAYLAYDQLGSLRYAIDATGAFSPWGGPSPAILNEKYPYGVSSPLRITWSAKQ